jgi:hypothetical protein
MPIYRLLQNMPMGPEEISRLTTAYEQALRAIGLVDRNDPIAEMIAKKIIEIGQTGVRSGGYFCSGGQGAWSAVRPLKFRFEYRDLATFLP